MTASTRSSRLFGKLPRSAAGGASMRPPSLIDKLAQLANGDLDLVHEAIWTTGGNPDTPAKLDDVVKYVVENRDRRSAGRTAA
ncbi:MAG TPA: hypothetical protein VF744_10680 [Beijerinckiaceae bacterium]|jgi:hypothetical protein